MTDDTPTDDPTKGTDGDGEERPADTPTDEGGGDPTEKGVEAGRDEPTDDDAGDERPEIEDDERADIDLSGVNLDAVDDDDDGDEQDGDDTDETTESSSTPDLSPDEGETWGDMYVDTLAVILVAIVDEYGDGAREMTSEDIEELANQPPIALNEQADRVMENMGGTRDLPPGQALVVGSAVVGSTVLLRETDVASDIVGELAGSIGGESDE